MSVFFLRVYSALLATAVAGTFYLFFYPTFHQCSFPSRNIDTGQQAPFRLLAFGDPQLEGDTSLPGNGHTELFPSIRRIVDSIQQRGFGESINSISREGRRLLHEDLPTAVRTYHKKLDLWGNDQYLAHIYRTVSRQTDPTHVVVLGDLLGSQWIDDDEFGRRSHRFWQTVFKEGERVPSDITDYKNVPAEELSGNKSWKNRIITVAGNHDIGYAGDIDEDRIRRFEDTYGRVNYEINFKLNDTSTVDDSTAKHLAPELRLIILNSMNLDEPALHQGLQQDSIDFLNQRLYWEIPQSDTAGTILLTHIPLYKEAGICKDGPFFEHFPVRPNEYYSGGIREQNHLTYDLSARILEGIVGPERTRRSIILNGHDHHGCDTYHSRTLIEKPLPVPEPILPREDEDDEAYEARIAKIAPVPLPEPEKWRAQQYRNAAKTIEDKELAGVREITVRSMMGEFGGHAGLLSAWWNAEQQEWQYEYATCAAGVQHIWWAIQVVNVITFGAGVAGVLLLGAGKLSSSSQTTTTERKKRQ